MGKPTIQKLGSLLGLMLFGFILFLGFYHFSQRFASRHSIHNTLGSRDRPDTFPNEILPPDPVPSKFVFRLNQAYPVGRARLIYRGLEGKTIFRIDVLIPELDPDRPYQYRLDIDSAEKGFRVAGQQFKLVAVRGDYIQLAREASR